MLFKNITYIDENFNIVPGAFIGTIDDKISYIGKTLPENPEKYGKVYNGQDKLLLPGLVNSHCHAAATILRSYADTQPLQE